jgi:hypothetical protein
LLETTLVDVGRLAEDPEKEREELLRRHRADPKDCEIYFDSDPWAVSVPVIVSLTKRGAHCSTQSTSTSESNRFNPRKWCRWHCFLAIRNDLQPPGRVESDNFRGQSQGTSTPHGFKTTIGQQTHSCYSYWWTSPVISSATIGPSHAIPGCYYADPIGSTFVSA